jgi:predicted alpha-1,6-mannanase (GH76 family)
VGRRGRILTPVEAAERAAAAQDAVLVGTVRRLWALPGTALGVNSRPPRLIHRTFLAWNYWWQAHLLDCLIDAELRAPDAGRRRLIRRVIRSVRVRNAGRWTNAYYDDMAWLGLALERADRLLGLGRPPVVTQLTGHLLDAWSGELRGGIPWRRGDEFKNAPANGPAAILLARTGFLDRAVATADWIDAVLRDPETDLIRDGARPDGAGGIRIETPIYTYNQGAVVGAEVELAGRSVAAARHAARVGRTVDAVADRLSVDGVLTGHTGGDSGLFTGNLARYLTLVATGLPGADAESARVRARAADLVRTSAEAAWRHAARTADGHVTFGPDWTRPARLPARRSLRSRRPAVGSGGPERDLSVQLSGWMLLEAAAALGTDGLGRGRGSV